MTQNAEFDGGGKTSADGTDAAMRTQPAGLPATSRLIAQSHCTISRPVAISASADQE